MPKRTRPDEPSQKRTRRVVPKKDREVRKARARRLGAIKPDPHQGGLKRRVNLSNDIREAVMEAAARVGSDGKGLDKLTGYMEFLARNEPKSYAVLLGKLMAIQIEMGNVGESFKRITPNMPVDEMQAIYEENVRRMALNPARALEMIATANANPDTDIVDAEFAEVFDDEGDEIEDGEDDD